MQNIIRPLLLVLWILHFQLASRIGPYEPLKIPAINYSVQYKNDFTKNVKLFHTISSSNMIYILQNSTLYAFSSDTGDSKNGGWQWQSSSRCVKGPLLYEPYDNILSNSLIFVLCKPNHLYSLNATDGSIVHHLVLDIGISFNYVSDSLMTLSPSFSPELYIPAQDGFVVVDIVLKNVTFVYFTPTAVSYSTVLAIKKENTQDIVLFFANIQLHENSLVHLFVTYANGSVIYNATDITSEESGSLIIKPSSSLYDPNTVYIATPQSNLGGVWKYSVSSNIPKWSWMVPQMQWLYDIVLDEKRRRMYVICTSVFALSLDDGEQLWELEPLSGFWGLSHAILASNGILYTMGQPLSAVNVTTLTPLVIWSYEYVVSLNGSLIRIPNQDDWPYLIIPENRKQLIAIYGGDNRIYVHSFVGHSHPTCHQLESDCSSCAELLVKKNIRQCAWCSSLNMCIEYVGVVNRTLYQTCSLDDLTTNSLTCLDALHSPSRFWWIGISVVSAGVLAFFVILLCKKCCQKNHQEPLLTQR